VIVKQRDCLERERVESKLEYKLHCHSVSVKSFSSRKKQDRGKMILLHNYFIIKTTCLSHDRESNDSECDES